MRNELKNRQLNYDCDDIQISRRHDDDGGGENPKISEVAHKKNWQLFLFLVCLRTLIELSRNNLEPKSLNIARSA